MGFLCTAVATVAFALALGACGDSGTCYPGSRTVQGVNGTSEVVSERFCPTTVNNDSPARPEDYKP
jgi:hypothetical protein